MTTDEVLRIAVELLERHALTGRQFSAWYYHRYVGMSLRDAAQAIRDEEHYEISHGTVCADSRYAHEIIVAMCQEAEDGRVMFGHTVAAGTETWFARDNTLQEVVHRVRALRRGAARATR